MSAIELIIDKRSRDLGGGFEVGRVLPYAKRRMVGPFIFFDEMGPLHMKPGVPRSLDVRPHPHIGLSTVTYLFNGAMTHRDSLGVRQEIRPAEVNWMVAGKGVTHSERFEHARIHGAVAEGAIEAEYRAPYVAHQPLEPISAVVRVGDDGVDIWTSHQFQRLAQQKVAKVAGVDVKKVRLRNQYAGGSFGHRLEFENVTLATEIAVKMKGETIKLTFSREEDFAQDFPRQIGMARPRGAVKDGKVVALDLPIATVS